MHQKKSLVLILRKQTQNLLQFKDDNSYLLVNGKKYFKFKADSCNLMREANIWITSYCLIISRGNSSGSSFLSTRYQFAFSGISIFWFRKIPLGLLRFPINKTKTLRNHQTFHDVRLEKNLKRCVYIKRCGVAAKIEVQEGCVNMGKSSFAFKKSAIKRS